MSLQERDQRLGLGSLCLLLGVASVAVLWTHSAAEHTAALRWMQGYTSADGVGCCSEHDCLPWSVAVLQHTGDQVTVRIGETVVPLPATSVHTTQDGQTYWCCKTDAAGHCPAVPTRETTRCVFYTVGM
jgi:hypothetical protein